MVTSFTEIESVAKEWPAKDRALLVERLLATFDEGEDVAAEEDWLVEAERRYEQYKAGKIGSKPGRQVFEDAKRSLQ